MENLQQYGEQQESKMYQVTKKQQKIKSKKSFRNLKMT